MNDAKVKGFVQTTEFGMRLLVPILTLVILSTVAVGITSKSKLEKRVRSSINYDLTRFLCRRNDFRSFESADDDRYDHKLDNDSRKCRDKSSRQKYG